MSKVKEILEKNKNKKREALISLLQEIQEAEGYISSQAVIELSRHLNVPASKIYGAATFYNQFRFEPLGKYHIMVCRGTACHVKGSASALKTAEDILNIKAGKTTKDGLFSLETVACMGACGLAPVISINGEFYAQVTAEKFRKIIEDIKASEKKI